jgi:hypothetical protein
MLLSRSRLDGRDDLASDAELGKGSERRELVRAVVTYALVKPDHAFLDDIFAVCADQEIGLGFDSDKVLVLADQVLGGELVSVLGQFDDLFIRLILKIRHIGTLLKL